MSKFQDVTEHWAAQRDAHVAQQVLDNLRKKVEFKTKRHSDYVDSIEKNVFTFCTGPAGTGKSYMAAYAALRMLIDSQRPYDTIVVTRPNVGCGRTSGFLPGDLKDKSDPWFRRMLENFYKLVGRDKTKEFLQNHSVVFEPFEYMRGSTFDDTVVLLDEAQNCTYEELELILTRVGQNCRYVIMGDTGQTDLKKSPDLLHVIRKTRKLPIVGCVKFLLEDTMRSEACRLISEALCKKPRSSITMDISFFSK